MEAVAAIVVDTKTYSVTAIANAENKAPHIVAAIACIVTDISYSEAETSHIVSEAFCINPFEPSVTAPENMKPFLLMLCTQAMSR